MKVAVLIGILFGTIGGIYYLDRYYEKKEDERLIRIIEYEIKLQELKK